MVPRGLGDDSPVYGRHLRLRHCLGGGQLGLCTSTGWWLCRTLQVWHLCPSSRHASYIGRSDWFQEGTADPNINATFDAFRVWDRALSTSQVQSLARTYGLYSNASSATSVSAGGDFQLQSALGANARLPVFNANFSVNPAAQVGGTINYKWQTVDTTDTSANQGLHQGSPHSGRSDGVCEPESVYGSLVVRSFSSCHRRYVL